MNKLLPIRPGKCIRKSSIPVLPFDSFRKTLLALTAEDGYIVQFFAWEQNDEVLLTAVVRCGNELFIGNCRVGERYPSLTPENAKFHLFEREIAEQYGVRPTGHPWLKNVRFHPNRRGKPDVFGNSYDDIPGNYPYYQVQGDDIHEVAVGPVHAGIIEPGHFRFQCSGEEVLHLEIQLGYQHRGVEQLLCTTGPRRRPLIAEAIAGDTAVANSLCYCRAIEALQEMTPTGADEQIRKIALELERLANHVGDLGALAGDVAFSTAAAYFGRLRGEFLNLLLVLCGNRFGKGLVRPGGVICRWDAATRAAIVAKVKEVRPQVKDVGDLLFTAHTVLGRFEGCGLLPRRTAAAIGLVGPVGRASGLDYDVRTFLGENSDFFGPAAETEKMAGDVFARAWIRFAEILQSLDFIEKTADQIRRIPELVAIEPENLPPDSFVVTMAEAWRGELSHCLLTDGDGKLQRYKVKDPSFHNWTGLALALRNEEISDFPLNNKSFNLSYCGFDL